MQSCNPDHLSALVKANDPEALRVATECYGHRLLAIGRRHCRNDEEAQDAVQDALLSAMEHQTDFRGDGPVVGWLVRMVVNSCQRIRRGRKNDHGLHDPEAIMTDPSADPERDAARSQLATALGDALLSLNAQDRAMVILSDIEGWKGPQVAEQLGLTPVALRARLSRARAKLRTQLDQTTLCLADL